MSSKFLMPMVLVSIMLSGYALFKVSNISNGNERHLTRKKNDETKLEIKTRALKSSDVLLQENLIAKIEALEIKLDKQGKALEMFQEKKQTIGASSDEGAAPVDQESPVLANAEESMFGGDMNQALNNIDQNFNSLVASGSDQINLDQLGLDSEITSFLDYNGDEMLSKDELARYFRDQRSTQRMAESRDIKDGQMPISKENYRGSLQRFDFVDLNQDGVLTKNEYMNYRRNGHLELVKRDKNGDLTLDIQEYGQGLARFKKLDVNSDAMLSSPEIRRAMFMGLW